MRGLAIAKMQAAKFGVPATIPITDDVRQSGCDAEEATFASVEGNMAVYRGVCDMGHHYDIKVELKQRSVEETRKQTVQQGEITLGGNEDEEERVLDTY